jgi:uncharacterized protein YdeI (YjbR/CyaY-like superfamily)
MTPGDVLVLLSETITKALVPERQRDYAEYISTAKRVETKQSRLKKNGFSA